MFHVMLFWLGYQNWVPLKYNSKFPFDEICLEIYDSLINLPLLKAKMAVHVF